MPKEKKENVKKILCLVICVVVQLSIAQPGA